MSDAPPRAFVVGWPVRQSRSPLVHGHWLERHGVAGSYRAEEIDEAVFAGFLTDLAGRGYVGGNVTVPHKVAAARLVDVADPAAAALGAVNTVWLENGRLMGANTDVHGFLANLDAEAPGWDAPLDRAVVLGAGGAARAVVYGLASRGVADIRVINRSPERARALADDFAPAVRVHGHADAGRALSGAGLVVNATSLGMVGKPPLDIDLSPLPATAVVNDLVYAPLETGLLAAARARGLAAVDGLGMLLHQAAPGFERWFGVRPEVTPQLRALIVADLEAR